MKNNNNLLIGILLLFLTVGCSEEFLERLPLDQEDSSNYYQTETQAFELLVSVYDVLQYQSIESWLPVQYLSDVLSDDSYAGGGDANDGANVDRINKFNVSPTSDQAYSVYKRNYIGIYRANLFLETIETIDVTAEFKVRTIAEAKFLRAYFYFELVKLYENVPLLTKVLSGPSEYQQSNNTPEEVYNQVALDLVEAIAGLPTELPSEELGRITKWAAEALLSRAYLFYNGVYNADLVAGDMTIGRTEALAYVEDVIANSSHDLLPDYNDIFHIAAEYSVESVFEIGHGDTPAWWDWGYVQGGEGNLAAQLQGPRLADSDNWDRGWSFAPVSQSLVDAMSGDPRIDATILFESELDGTLSRGYQHTGYFSKKYSSDAEHWGANGQFEHNRTCNNRVIRYSEVLLNAAELGSSNAQNYLDQVRARAGVASVPVTEESLFEERRLEFALEGHRYFDLIRRGLTYAESQLTEKDVRGANYEGDQVIFDVTFDMSKKGFLPIPQTEIDLSGGLIDQNDGY